MLCPSHRNSFLSSANDWSGSISCGVTDSCHAVPVLATFEQSYVSKTLLVREGERRHLQEVRQLLNPTQQIRNKCQPQTPRSNPTYAEHPLASI